MDRIEDLRAFIAIVEKRSLTAAACQLCRSLQSISRSLSALERELGVELVRRTTRRSAPTDSGLAFYRRVSAALAELDAASLEAADRRLEPSGLLRLSSPTAFGQFHLVSIISEFAKAYPKINVELDLSDRYVNIREEGFDVAIRLGDLSDSSLKARRLGTLRRAIFAAPAYLARNGKPRKPSDLVNHQCIVHVREGNNWQFSGAGRIQTVKVGGRFRTSGNLAAIEAALRGQGIANSALYLVRALVDQAKLEIILERFEPPPIPVHAVWAQSNLLPAKTRSFIDFLAVKLKTEPA
jgi:DNA-binding transcriptional LysR family regulator